MVNDSLFYSYYKHLGLQCKYKISCKYLLKIYKIGILLLLQSKYRKQRISYAGLQNDTAQKTSGVGNLEFILPSAFK